MMKAILALVFFACVGLAVAGCGVNSGFVHDATSGDQHQYRMDLSGVRFMRSVSGASSLGYIFCLPSVPGIPLDKGLYKQAMESLQEDAKLKPNEVLKDLRSDFDSTCYLGVYFVQGLTVSADVYEVTPVGASSSSAAPGSPATGRPGESAPASAARPAGKLTYAQLQEAYAQIQSNQDSTGHLPMARRILGNPHKVDADSEYWFGTLPGKGDCFVLRVSTTKGDSLDTAPNEKCK